MRTDKYTDGETYYNWWVSFCGGVNTPSKNIIELFGGAADEKE
jgi:hypothetical protein